MSCMECHSPKGCAYHPVVLTRKTCLSWAETLSCLITAAHCWFFTPVMYCSLYLAVLRCLLCVLLLLCCSRLRHRQRYVASCYSVLAAALGVHFHGVLLTASCCAPLFAWLQPALSLSASGTTSSSALA